MGLPHFGAEQPVDLYYFSELTVNVFCIANICNKPTTMLAYGYTEYQGERGATMLTLYYSKG